MDASRQAPAAPGVRETRLHYQKKSPAFRRGLPCSSPIRLTVLTGDLLVPDGSDSALTARILLLLAGLLAAALLLAGLLTRVLVLLARILVLIGH